MVKGIIPNQEEKKNYVLIVLDSSGSMGSIKRETIKGFNENLETIRVETENMETKISLVTFNDPENIQEVIWLEDVHTVEPLTEKSYKPDNMTALYDAVGYTVEKFQDEVELSSNDGVLLVIVTDGQENSSRKFTQERMKKMLGGLEEHPNWTITFIGANQDVMLNTGAMGIDYGTGNSLAFAASSRGMVNMTKTTNTGYSNYFDSRKRGITKVDNLYDGASASADSDEN